MSEIEKNVPIPTMNDRHPSLRDMEVGDSFSFDLIKRNSIQSRASTIKRVVGYEYTIKKIDEDSCRVWRIA